MGQKQCTQNLNNKINIWKTKLEVSFVEEGVGEEAGFVDIFGILSIKQ